MKKLSEAYSEEIYAFLGPVGRMIAGSKSSYRKRLPHNVAIFNANVVAIQQVEKKKLLGLYKASVTQAEKIWWGDFDITADRNHLKNLAEATGCTIALLYEMDGRFENEHNPRWERYVYLVNPEGEEQIGSMLHGYIHMDKEKIEWVIDNRVSSGTL